MYQGLVVTEFRSRNPTRDKAHEFLDGPDINQNGGSTASYGLIKGSYDSSVNIIGAQMKYKFN